MEPICRVLAEHGVSIAPSTYYAATNRPPSARTTRDAWLIDQIRRVHTANYGVYGARKVGQQLRREDVAVARCTVERLMRADGLAGVVRDKAIRPTVAGDRHQRAGDLVNRDFSARAAQSDLSRGLHPCDRLVRDRLRRVRRRRVLAGDRGLVGRHEQTQPVGAGRAGDGPVAT
ncbi:hypothetical protein GCM10009835_12710 [Planosporangium flavigriseum]|uniref:HTH-like domain-containing protein n=1 Tax=Planosporangium flavigriseum TaxID=373681 RepID=A0A8J3PMJ2_9ACTN|nr:hypothetical protein Pfl04_33610 [Planosporangium flavigriseum]